MGLLTVMNVVWVIMSLFTVTFLPHLTFLFIYFLLKSRDLSNHFPVLTNRVTGQCFKNKTQVLINSSFSLTYGFADVKPVFSFVSVLQLVPHLSNSVLCRIIKAFPNLLTSV